MRRRIIWRYGDSAPIFGNIVASVQGDGDLKVFVGFPVSAATVAFSKAYNRYLIENLGYGYQAYAFAPSLYVDTIDDDSFTIRYNNIPDTLDFNYFVM